MQFCCHLALERVLSASYFTCLKPVGLHSVINYHLKTVFDETKTFEHIYIALKDIINAWKLTDEDFYVG